MTDAVFSAHDRQADALDAEPPSPDDSLWPGDTGTLRDDSRRALLELLQGPYLSAANRGRLWTALLADTDAIRSRLHDLFLDLVIDRTDEIAFVRPVDAGERAVPLAVRARPLTFMDTLMLLVLRQHLVAARGERRVIVGKDEIYEQLVPYRVDRDEADFERRMNASWTKLSNKLGVLHRAGADDRVEISPALRLIVDDDRVAALQREYDRFLVGGASDGTVGDAAAGEESDGDTEEQGR